MKNVQGQEYSHVGHEKEPSIHDENPIVDIKKTGRIVNQLPLMMRRVRRCCMDLSKLYLRGPTIILLRPYCPTKTKN